MLGRGCGYVRAPCWHVAPLTHIALSLGGVRRPASKGQGKARVGWSGQQAELAAESVSLVWGQVLTEHVGFPCNGGQDPAPGLPVGCLGTKWWGRWAERLALKSSYLTGRKEIRSLGLSFQPGAAPRGGSCPVNSASRWTRSSGVCTLTLVHTHCYTRTHMHKCTHTTSCAHDRAFGWR